LELNGTNALIFGTNNNAIKKPELVACIEHMSQRKFVQSCLCHQKTGWNHKIKWPVNPLFWQSSTTWKQVTA